uniref:Aldehyde dehydrogenase domain-containing protein n=1 Tax=Panagrolaimus sp. JU765 TaxID=591449 RepID=A0AC34QXN4_9BILA
METIFVEKTMTTAIDTPMITKKPKGVVLLIGPWNYPINMIFLPLIPILAAGNTAIIKPSELAKNTAQILDELIGKYFDKRHVTVIQGDANETSELLKERFDHIMYTGSTNVGKIIMKAAAEHLTPVTLELGGKSPVVIEDENVDIKIATKRISWGKWLNCGQTCLAPDYILTTSKLKTKVINGIIDSIKEFYAAPPPSKPSNPSISKNPECISCLDEGKKYYSELLPEFKKYVTRIAHYEAAHNTEIPDKNDLVHFYKYLKRLLIGAAIYTANKDAHYKNFAGEHSVLFDLKIIKEKIEELDEFYYDRILGHDPTLKTKAKTIEFYRKISSRNDKFGYLKKLVDIFNSYDFPLHVPIKKQA